jgi:hypothetical protein
LLIKIVRDEDTLNRYFDHYLTRHGQRVKRNRGNQPLDRKIPPILHPGTFLKKRSPPTSGSGVVVPPLSGSGTDAEDAEDQADSEEGVEVETEESLGDDVEEVIFVRKLNSLESLRARRTKVLRELEVVSISDLSPLVAADALITI